MMGATSEIPTAVVIRQRDIENELAGRRSNIDHHTRELDRNLREIEILEAELRGITGTVEAYAEAQQCSDQPTESKRPKRDLRALTLEELRRHEGLSALDIVEKIGGCRVSQIENALSYLLARGEVYTESGGWFLGNEATEEAAQ